MAKLERIDGTTESTTEIKTLKDGTTIEELPDYSIKVTTARGLIAKFQEPSHKDFEQFEVWVKECPTQTEAMRRLGSRLCIQWGDREGVTPEIWASESLANSAALMGALNTFFPDATLDK
jgi:hypothetical protein